MSGNSVFFPIIIATIIIAIIIIVMAIGSVGWSPNKAETYSDWSLYGYSRGSTPRTRIVRGPVAGGIIVSQIIPDMSPGNNCWMRDSSGKCTYRESCDMCPNCTVCPACDKCS